jgi:hypothetical protein
VDSAESSSPPPPPLDADLANFYRLAAPLHDFSTHIKPPTTPMPALKRLGQPPFMDDPLERLLARAYQAATDQALALAFADEDQTE